MTGSVVCLLISSPCSSVKHTAYLFLSVYRGETRPGWEDRAGCSPGEPAGPSWEHQELDGEDHEADRGFTTAQPQ